MKNVRIWQFVNDSAVKITIRPGVPLRHYRFSRDCEGYSSELNRWWMDENGDVWNSVYYEGRDCDGRVSRGGLYKLAEVAAIAWPEQGCAYPSWTKIKEGRRDYSAEAMNY
jgi:hypothetical protein